MIIWHCLIFNYVSLHCEMTTVKKQSEKRVGWGNVDRVFTSARYVCFSIHICTSSIITNDWVLGGGVAWALVGVSAGSRGVGSVSRFELQIHNSILLLASKPSAGPFSPCPHSCVNEEPVAGHIDGATRGQGWGPGLRCGRAGRRRRQERFGDEKWKWEGTPHGSRRKYCWVMKTWCGPRVRWRPPAATQQQLSRSERRGRARRAPLGLPSSEEEGVTSHLLSSLEFHIQPPYSLLFFFFL